MSGKRKVISVGDYVKRIDSVEFINVPEGDIPIRIRRPSAKDALLIMEMVQRATSEGMEEALSGVDPKTMDTDQRVDLLRFSYDYDATLISSCCYHPDMDGDEPKKVQSDSPKKIWEDKDSVLETCSEALFSALRTKIKGTGVADQVTQGEAGK